MKASSSGSAEDHLRMPISCGGGRDHTAFSRSSELDFSIPGCWIGDCRLQVAFRFALRVPMVIIQKMTWEQLAEVNRATAQHLRGADDAGFSRGVCGRAYYAAYALVTACLPDSMKFGRGWKNPEHGRLPSYVHQIPELRVTERQAIRSALRRLRQRREDADYRPAITVDADSSRESMRDVAVIFRLLSHRATR